MIIKVARKRFVDSVLQAVDERFVRRFQAQVHDLLDAVDDAQLKDLLEESKDRQQRRHDLEVQRQSLRSAVGELNNFLYGGDGKEQLGR